DLAVGLEGRDVGRFADLDAVATGAFGGVQGFVGLGYQGLKGERVVAAEAGDAKAGGQRDAFAAEFEFAAGPLFAQPVDRHFDVLLFDVGDDEQEFVAAHAAAKVGGARVAFQDFGKTLEANVAGVVAATVVDLFERIEIG